MESGVGSERYDTHSSTPVLRGLGNSLSASGRLAVALAPALEPCATSGSSSCSSSSVRPVILDSSPVPVSEREVAVVIPASLVEKESASGCCCCCCCCSLGVPEPDTVDVPGCGDCGALDLVLETCVRLLRDSTRVQCSSAVTEFVFVLGEALLEMASVLEFAMNFFALEPEVELGGTEEEEDS